ncbi:galactosyltransferase [Gregarina niphandrodes]|uniref:Hexosyltransferase n=1 Tax=Gregarina niphandrodes TaxID=110365 RepID=A0A023B0D7_GRENI|nr:galactosyltransferase [Gregarina niphandrodes]EZG45262.1 galactosyltransferase [Gregarina niphandrodes]|eukprot:XP_011132534.1 galactosyltransferase [Gregarina niphandrodes]
MKPRCSDYSYINVMYHTQSNATDERQSLREWVTILNKRLCLWVMQQNASSDTRALRPCPVLVRPVFPTGRNVECGERLIRRGERLQRLGPVAYDPNSLDGDGCHWDSQLVTEQLKHGDLIIANYADQYRALAVKSSLMYRAVADCSPEWTAEFAGLSGARPTLLPNDEIFRHVDFTYPRWFVKTDSDMILNLPAVFHYLKAWDAIDLFRQNQIDIRQVHSQLEARRQLDQAAHAERRPPPSGVPSGAVQRASLTPEIMMSRSRRVHFWLGKRQRDNGVKRDPTHKNREEVWMLNQYPPYTYGSFYAMTDHLLEAVAAAYVQNRTAYSNEDTQLGIIVDKLNHWPTENKTQWDLDVVGNLSGIVRPQHETHIASILRFEQLQSACGSEFFLDPAAEAKLLAAAKGAPVRLPRKYARRPRNPNQKIVSSIAQCDCNRWLASFRTTKDDSVDMEDAVVNCPIQDHWLTPLLQINQV